MNYPGRIIKKGEKDSVIVKAVQERLNIKGFGAAEGDQSEPADDKSVPVGDTTEPVGNPTEPVVDQSDPGSINSALLKKTLEIAALEIGVMEDPPGSNRGRRVEEFLESAGCQAGDPWCASFVYWCFREAAKSLGIANPLVKSGSCMDHWNRTPGKKIMHGKATNDPSLIKPGFIFIIDHGNGRGHTGIVKTAENGYIGTIEGNTNTDGGREGLCVAELQRKILTISAGFIDYR